METAERIECTACYGEWLREPCSECLDAGKDRNPTYPTGQLRPCTWNPWYIEAGMEGV